MSFAVTLLSRAAARRARIVLPEGADPRVRDAAARLVEEGIAQPIVLGDGAIDPRTDERLGEAARLLRRRRPEHIRDGLDALDQATDPLRFGAALVALGEADACVAGVQRTVADALQAALWAIGPLPDLGVVGLSHYVLLPDDRVVTFAMAATVEAPSPGELARVGLAACRDRVRSVGDSPRVAFLSHSTKGSGSGPAVDRVREAALQFGALAPGIPADGEIQADAALLAVVAERKAPTSPLGGRANVLVFPSADAGDIAVHLMDTLGGARVLGPIFQGLARPMAGLSPEATPDDIVQVAALVALQAEATT